MPAHVRCNAQLGPMAGKDNMMTVTIEPWAVVVAIQLLIGVCAFVWFAIEADGIDLEGITILAIAEAFWIAPVLVLAWLGA